VVGLETYLKELGIDRFTQEVDTVVVAPFSKKEEGFAQKVGKTLRGAGVHVDMVLPPYGVKAAFKRAERTGSNKVILVMPEEAKQENVVLKNLETSESQTVSLQKLADLLK
jgi:histidyl-tRNA synthetase